MGYYVRVLSTSATCVPLQLLQAKLTEKKLAGTFPDTEGTAEDWEQIVLCHEDGKEIASIERNVVESGSLGESELEEFADEVKNAKPTSAAKWLLDYFPGVKCIYAFQFLNGTEHKNGWEILGAVKDCIHSFAPSIMQADYEGFSNEAGYHILWQFSDKAKGEWWMGILRDGQWVQFQMDLANWAQREAFIKGEIPAGAKMAK